jgi:hypothetical protein
MQQELGDVSNILWRERRLLELLVFKLEEEQLVLASGRARWLTHATREVESVLTEIKRLELDRAVHVEALAQLFSLDSNPTLRQLVEAAPDPWSGIFDEHRIALLELAQEIDGVARSNRDMLSRGQQAAREALASMGEIDLDGYTPRGQTDVMVDRAAVLRIVDEAM